MRRKALLLTTIIFFLLVNTTYFWEGKLGMLAFPAFLLLVMVYGILLIALAWQLFQAGKEKFSDRSRLLIIVSLTAVLALTYFMPAGLIDFDILEGEDLLVAEREGTANCMTTFRFKEHLTFRERTVCFGVDEVKGTYHI